MNRTPLVTDALDRLADIVPLTPLARLEIDGVLTALCEAVRRQALAELEPAVPVDSVAPPGNDVYGQRGRRSGPEHGAQQHATGRRRCGCGEGLRRDPVESTAPRTRDWLCRPQSAAC